MMRRARARSGRVPDAAAPITGAGATHCPTRSGRSVWRVLIGLAVVAMLAVASSLMVNDRLVADQQRALDDAARWTGRLETIARLQTFAVQAASMARGERGAASGDVGRRDRFEKLMTAVRLESGMLHRELVAAVDGADRPGHPTAFVPTMAAVDQAVARLIEAGRRRLDETPSDDAPSMNELDEAVVSLMSALETMQHRFIDTIDRARARQGEAAIGWLRLGAVTGAAIIVLIVVMLIHGSRLATRLRQLVGTQRETQDRLGLAIDAARAGLWDWHVNERLLYTNPTYFTMVGDEPVESPIRAGYYYDRLHPDDAPSLIEKIDSARSAGDAPYIAEFRLRHQDGSYRWIRSIGRAVEFNRDGSTRRMIGQHLDITAQHLVKERLDLAIRAAKEGLWDWTMPTNEVYFNDTFFTMLGYAPDELPHTLETWRSLRHPDDLTGAERAMQRHMEGESSVYRSQHRLRRRDGSWMWTEDVGEVVERSPDGTPLRITGVHLDIDASKRLEIALRTTVELQSGPSEDETLTALCRALASTYDVAFVGVARLEECGTRARMSAGWNGQPIEPFEYDLRGTPCDVAVRSDACVEPRDVCRQFPDDHMLVEMGAESYAGVRLEDGHGRAVGVMVIVDMKPLDPAIDHRSMLRLFGARAAMELERADTERRLRAARDQAEASSRAKSDFLANMSHEIRTPMTAILGFADLLAEHGELARDPERAADSVRTIRRNADHLLTVINDILDVSKIEAGRMTVERVPCSPMQLVGQVAELMRPRADDKGIDLRVSSDAVMPERVLSDPTRLRQILMNLVGNAVKFTARGAVSVHVGCTAGDPGGGRLEIAISDTGIGMTDEQRRQIERFDAFTQADGSMTRRFGGTGLGLRISSSFARLLGGGIRVSSTPGRGSTFVLTVDAGPITRDAMAASTPPRTSTDDAARRVEPARSDETAPLDGRRILLAEDGSDNQRLLRFLLERSGATVDLAVNGAVAIAMEAEARRRGRSFDLVLMDVQMPEVDGYEATRRLRDDGCTTPIVALTALTMVGDRRKCLEAGCNDHLSKPIDRERLIEVCRRWAAQRTARAA